MGLAGIIWPGQKFVYDFVAQPYGVYPYHCLMAPVEEHINRGLYGMMIIDQPYAEKGPHATEMVVLINGYSFTKANQTNPTEEGPPTPAAVVEEQMVHPLQRFKPVQMVHHRILMEIVQHKLQHHQRNKILLCHL